MHGQGESSHLVALRELEIKTYQLIQKENSMCFVTPSKLHL